MLSTRERRVLPVAAGALALAMFAGGCASSTSGSQPSAGPATSSSGSTSGSTDPGTSSEPATGTPTGASGASPLAAAGQAAVAYTGGTPGKADAAMSPIEIGFINQQGATPGFPEATAAAQSAVELLNDYAGGIGGHPIKLVTCFVVSSEEDGQKCAQQMAADKSVVAVQLGLLTVGQASIYKTLNGAKPILGGAPTSPADISQKEVPFFIGGTSNWPSIASYAAKTLKAKSVAIIYDGADPGAAVAVKLESQVLKQNSVPFKAVPSAGPSGWSAALVSSNARGAGVVTFIGSPPTCVPFANAVKQLGVKTPIVTLDFCASGAVKAALGDFAPWTYSFQIHNPFVPAQDPQIAALTAAMTKYQPGAALTTAYPFSDTMVLAKVLTTLGPAKLDATGVGKALLGFTAPVWGGAKAPKCGFLAATGNPAYCTTDTFLYTYVPGKGWSNPTVAAWNGK